MGEIDYQMALLLQHKFEQEQLQERRGSVSLDSELAKSLQDVFEQENQVESSSKNLAYKVNKSRDSTKSLTDPSWEVIDPTPDIHMLFMAFNERFFWNKLLAVCVSWSKRMTTCAGICSYQGRGGMCSITLSEPLLKLRPRKDLVETLLHEMIHAYLFVTHNNRDRDGHGTEFHKHMNRINEEAGTRITVYHSFHDEVRLYQQHWWRCDGPCQKWKPYYGTVRRAMNRAPGPSDRWWGEHSRSCGGTFIKIKEPEKPETKKIQKSKSESKVTTASIKKYFPKTPGTSSSASSANIPRSISQDSMANKNTPKTSNSNIKTLVNTNSSQIGNVISSKVNNIVGFTKTGSNSGLSTSSSSSKFNGSCKINNSTIVITKRTGASSSSKSTETSTNDVRHEDKLSSGNQLVPGSNSRSSDDEYAVVRNHWINRFESSIAATNKRKLSDSPEQSTKVRKTSTTEEVETVNCPVCSQKVTLTQLNSHLDDCLLDEPSKECIICGLKLVMSDYEKHVNTCCKFEQQISDDDVFVIAADVVDNRIKCESCGDIFQNSLYREHLKICKKKCVVCEIEICATVYDIHVEKCLHMKFDEMENSYRDVFVSCLACNKKINKAELNEHLEDCMSLSHIFNDSNEMDADEAVSKENNYNCPFCMKLIVETALENHLNSCLNSKDDNTTSNSKLNKTIIIDSFSSDESF